MPGYLVAAASSAAPVQIEPPHASRVTDLKPKNREPQMDSKPDHRFSDQSSLIGSPDSISQSQTLSFNRYIRGSLVAARCKACGTLFERPSMFKKSTARFCYYTGAWYCRDCHHNEMSLIPGQIVHLWDFAKYPVCAQAAYQIASLSSLPLIDMLVVNPELYQIAPELNEIRKIRTKLMLIAEFARGCPRGSASLFQQIGERVYIVTEIHLYSLHDLHAVHKKKFGAAMQTFAKHFLDHIAACEVCKGRGYYCLKCNNGELLFPFEPTKIHRCPACTAVYHKDCFRPTEGEHCIICQKKSMLRAQRTAV
jgi:hypothetical protein